jgi:hypothetical protein
MQAKVGQIQVKDPMIIAPCGINCSLCRAYVRDMKPCPGCRGEDLNKSHSCLACTIKNCAVLASGDYPFCYSCDSFPCPLLVHLDKRYRTRYGVSVIANLESIQAVGVKRFVVEEAARWTCPECGSRLCMHKPQCGTCGCAWRDT